jgi:hypothetical protein
MKRASLAGLALVFGGLGFEQRNRPGGCRLEGFRKGKRAVLLEKTNSEGLLQDEAASVNPPACEQPVQSLGKTPHPAPTHLVLRWRGGGAPTVQPFIGNDVVFAYVMAEHMFGLRDGDAVILTACHWSAQVWGRA